MKNRKSSHNPKKERELFPLYRGSKRDREKFGLGDIPPLADSVEYKKLVKIVERLVAGISDSTSRSALKKIFIAIGNLPHMKVSRYDSERGAYYHIDYIKDAEHFRVFCNEVMKRVKE